ncbi:DUF222 domain-containing protein [Planotetraspora thailandica]|nr:HNH endonuclease signature motif containing protein [Planotetraspora thailandica]
MPPGPELTAALDGLDLVRLSGYDAVIVLQAHARLEAYVQARKAMVMAEVGLYEPSPCDMKKMARPDKYAADEIRAALTLTRRAAEYEYWFSYFLATRLPQVRDALLSGHIDKARARVFCDWLEDVPEHVAAAVADELLPKAGGWTIGQLKDKIKRLLLAADPEWARRKYERALQRRRVEGMRHHDGTVTITGHQLPVDQAAAAIARVNAIAQRAKRAGLSGPIDHIRTDVFLSLLDGGLAGLDDDEIIRVLLEAAAEAALGEEDDYDDQLSDEAFPATGGGGGREGQAVGDPSPAGDPEDGDLEDGDLEDGDLEDGDSEGDDGEGGEIDDRDADDPKGGDRGPNEAPARPHGGGTGGLLGASAAGEVRVRVTTLFHLDDFPGELAGWGPIHANLARRLVKRQVTGEWRFAVCDDDGHLLYAGITVHRPGGWPRGHVASELVERMGKGGRPHGGSTRRSAGNGIVELQISLSSLRRWQTDLSTLGGWAQVISDIARQVDTMSAQGLDSDPRRRFARARLRRWVQMRDRVCTAPGCRAPASRSELDHISPYGRGGHTIMRNLEAACAHDHDLRDHGWKVVQSIAGQVVWISRTGHRYPVDTPPVIEDLPEPITARLPMRQGASLGQSEIDVESYGPASWEDTPVWWEPA